jgi:RNA polymerase sigma-70 factor, ECF subfamily
MRAAPAGCFFYFRNPAPADDVARTAGDDAPEEGVEKDAAEIFQPGQGIQSGPRGGAAQPGNGATLSQGAAGPEARDRFEALVADQLDGLYRTALRLSHNRAAAEDLVQEVMLKAWRSFHTFQEGTSIRAWLHRILMNAYFDDHRKHMREPELVDQEDVGDFYLYDRARESSSLGDAGNPEVEVLDRILDTEVRDSLEALPPQFRAAVLLADVEGFSYKEIADILGVPVGTVMSRLSRGRHLLQRRLWDFARARHFIGGEGT